MGWSEVVYFNVFYAVVAVLVVPAGQPAALAGGRTRAVLQLAGTSLLAEGRA